MSTQNTDEAAARLRSVVAMGSWTICADLRAILDERDSLKFYLNEHERNALVAISEMDALCARLEAAEKLCSAAVEYQKAFEQGGPDPEKYAREDFAIVAFHEAVENYRARLGGRDE